MKKKYLQQLIKKRKVETKVRFNKDTNETSEVKSELQPLTECTDEDEPLVIQTEQRIYPEGRPSTSIFMELPSHSLPSVPLSQPPFSNPHNISQPSTPPLTQDLANWAVSNHISQNTLTELLCILKKSRGIREFEELPLDSRTLLKTKPIINNNIVKYDDGSAFYYFGLENNILRILNDFSVENIDKICIDVGIDGLPLVGSSNSQFWPVLGSLNLNTFDRPFVIGVYHGTSKPSDSTILLRDFIKEYLEIKNNGLLFKEKVLSLKISKFIMDAPAKSFILGIKGHNSYTGCTKCLVEGRFVNNRMCFTDLNCPLRTDTGFRSKHYDEFHKTDSPILASDIDIVKDIPLDYMHLVCLGVMKALLKMWVKGNKQVALVKMDYDILDTNLSDIGKCISRLDFSRTPRTIKEIDHWKACEFRQFLLYTGPVVLKDRLNPTKYEHFLSLHCAIRILCDAEICIVHNNFARELLIYFVKNYSKLYGEEHVNHNVHNLIHLPDDVSVHGPLDKFSAFKFENFMSDIKKMLQKSKHPLQQFIKRTYERTDYLISEKNHKNKQMVLTKEGDTYFENLLNNKLVKSYHHISFDNFSLGIDSRNNHCILHSGEVVKIIKFIQDLQNKNIFLLFKKYKTFNDFFSSPCKSKLFFCGKVEDLSDSLELTSITNIFKKTIIYKNYCISYIHHTSV